MSGRTIEAIMATLPEDAVLGGKCSAFLSYFHSFDHYTLRTVSKMKRFKFEEDGVSAYVKFADDCAHK